MQSVIWGKRGDYGNKEEGLMIIDKETDTVIAENKEEEYWFKRKKEAEEHRDMIKDSLKFDEAIIEMCDRKLKDAETDST